MNSGSSNRRNLSEVFSERPVPSHGLLSVKETTRDVTTGAKPHLSCYDLTTRKSETVVIILVSSSIDGGGF